MSAKRFLQLAPETLPHHSKTASVSPCTAPTHVEGISHTQVCDSSKTTGQLSFLGRPKLRPPNGLYRPTKGVVPPPTCLTCLYLGLRHHLHICFSPPILGLRSPPLPHLPYLPHLHPLPVRVFSFPILL